MYAFQNVNPQTFYDKSQQSSNRALSAYSSYDRSRKSEGEAEQYIPKTTGGTAGAAAGGALAGATYGAMEGSKVSPGWGTLIGAVGGALLYWLT